MVKLVCRLGISKVIARKLKYQNQGIHTKTDNRKLKDLARVLKLGMINKAIAGGHSGISIREFTQSEDKEKCTQ